MPGSTLGVQIQGENKDPHLCLSWAPSWQGETSIQLTIKLVTNTGRIKQGNMKTAEANPRFGGEGRPEKAPWVKQLEGWGVPTDTPSRSETRSGTQDPDRPPGFCLQRLTPPRHACVGSVLLFKVPTERVTRKRHGFLPTIRESPAT
jgi:hypothetical protein